MTLARKIALLSSALAMLAGQAGVAAPLDLTGTWQPKYWTLKISLQQDGDRVWGTGGSGGFWFRGSWDGKRYVIVANNFEAKRRGTCKPRGTFTLSGANLSALSTQWVTETSKVHKGPWQRVSPMPADKPAEYPYAMELEYCGFLRTYELAFASASDRLQGAQWPILAAVGDLMKSNPALRIEVQGHTDSVGNAQKNQQLSERRAQMVRKILADKYGADAGRIDAKGFGQDQPVGDNKTDDGRALNRRVEIVLAR